MNRLLLVAALTGCLDAPPTGTPDGRCGTLRALRDGFALPLDDERWSASGVEIVGDAARMSAVAGTVASLESDLGYQVDGGELVVELDTSGVGDGLLDVSVTSVDATGATLRLLAGELSLILQADGEQQLDAIPIEDGHWWWRLRQEAGALFWATSADGTAWDERGPFQPVGAVAHVRFELDAAAADAVVYLEGVNTEGRPEPLCPAATLVDDFASLSPRWQVDEQGDCDISADGSLLIGYSAQAFCALTSIERFALADSAFAVELADAGDCRPQPIVTVRLASGEEVGIFCYDEGGIAMLAAQTSAPAGTLAKRRYDPSADRFIRVRGDTELGGVLFETSAGDGDWVRLAVRLLAAADLDAARLRFYLGGDTSGAFESVAFDSLGLAP